MRSSAKLSFRGAKAINYLRKVNLESYAYVVAAVKLLGDEVEEIMYLKGDQNNGFRRMVN